MPSVSALCMSHHHAADTQQTPAARRQGHGAGDEEIVSRRIRRIDINTTQPGISSHLMWGCSRGKCDDW